MCFPPSFFATAPPPRDSSFGTWPRMLDPSRRSRTLSEIRQESANRRTYEAWMAVTRNSRRNNSHSGRGQQSSNTSSSSSENISGSSARASPRDPSQAANERRAWRADFAPGAGMRYRGKGHETGFGGHYAEHANYRGAPSSYSYARNGTTVMGTRGGTCSTAVSRAPTPTACRHVRPESFDVSSGMYHLRLKREQIASSRAVGKRTPSPQQWRRTPSCRPNVTLPETEVYASPCFTRNYREPAPPAEITMHMTQRVQRNSGGFTDFAPRSSLFHRTAAHSPSREAMPPLPIQPMPVRRHNRYEVTRDRASFLNHDNRMERRHHSVNRNGGRARGSRHREGRSPSPRRFI